LNEPAVNEFVTCGALEAAGVDFIAEDGGGPACGFESGSTENLGK